MKGVEELKHLYNSKQALNNIRFNYFESKRNENANVEHFWFDTIEKELKALEIIKRNIYVNDNKVFRMNWEWSLTEEEYELLKEVLNYGDEN